MKKYYYSWQDIETMCINIVIQMAKDKWLPDYIVGITRGGNVPATIISNMLGIRCETLKVSFRDDSKKSESNKIMANDSRNKNILIIDDINDTGATFNWIKDDWGFTGQLNLRFAVLTENLSSEFDGVNYWSHEVNKNEFHNLWLVYPWENVGVHVDEFV